MIQCTDQNEWLIIVNPNAGNGKGEKDWGRMFGIPLDYERDVNIIGEDKKAVFRNSVKMGNKKNFEIKLRMEIPLANFDYQLYKETSCEIHFNTLHCTFLPHYRCAKSLYQYRNLTFDNAN
jgi:hypothetical protein